MDEMHLSVFHSISNQEETVSAVYAFNCLLFFVCLKPWSKDCTTLTLHDLTEFYVERVTAHRIKFNYHSCFHNRLRNLKTKLKLKQL